MKSNNINKKMEYLTRKSKTIERLCSLYEDRSQDIILASVEIPSQTLKKFSEEHVDGSCEFPDMEERVAFWDAYLAEKSDVCDDSVPCAYLSELDQGLYGGLVGGEVRYMCNTETGWISSMVPPVLNEWADLEKLSVDANSEWFLKYKQQLKIFADAAKGKFGISNFVLIDSLNFLFELLGATEIYLALNDPVKKKMLLDTIDFAFDLNVKIQETFFDVVPLFEEGTCSNMTQWSPGKIISESIDPFHMTSVDYFEQWGREPVERIFAGFDGGVTHIHGNGRHLLKAVSTVKGLKAIVLGDDKGFPKAFDVLVEIKKNTADLPLIVSVDLEKFNEALHKHCLPGGVFYRVTGAPDLNSANRCMDLVHKCRV